MNELALAAVATFASIAILTGVALNYSLSRTSPARRRLADLAGGTSASGIVVDQPRLTDIPEASIKRVGTFIPKSPKEMGRIQRRLAVAGYHGVKPLAIYAISEVALAVVGFVVVFAAFGMRGLLLAAVVGFVGFMLPGLVLHRLVLKRKKEIQNGLADALDLMIVCLEAGLGIDQAILKTADEMGISYPALGEEFRLINIETRAGKPRLDAFRNFAKRTQVDDVRSFVAMLVQTDRFGTSVAQALRTFAEVLRTKRRQRAEEKAAKLGVKLVFPLVFCLFPAFFVVAMGGAVIKLIHLFANRPDFGNVGGY